VLIVVSPHTLPGSELRMEGAEKIARHFGRVVKGGISDVTLEWVGEGEDFISWRDSGVFWGTTKFIESHTARIDSNGRIVEQWIFSLYERP